MANKIKVAGYSKKTVYEGNIEYRNFSPDLVGVQLASDGGTPLFTMGNFAITTNMDPKVDKSYVTSKFSDFITLDNLELSVQQSEVLLKNNTSTFLNLNEKKLKNYALFGSMTEYIRISLEDVITNWPASLYVSPMVKLNGRDLLGNTYEEYSYDYIVNESTFKVNTNFLINQYQINFLTNGTIVDTFNETNDLRNMAINYGSYAILRNNIEYDVLSFTGSTYTTNDYIYFKVKGNPFTGISSNVYYHIKPKKLIQDAYFNGLSGLTQYLLNRDTIPLYKATFDYPTKTDTGMIMYSTKSVTWPMTDGYNIDFDTKEYTDYATQLLDIATNYDLSETNLMSRFLVSESISAFDTTPIYLDEMHQDTTTGQKVNKTLNIYGRSFDDINQFIQGISLAHTVSYNKEDNVPDKYLKDLARMLGWELASTIVGDNLLNNYVNSTESTYSGVSVGLTSVQNDTELWRRLILNSPWIWKSKGARKSIEFLINFMGIPKGLMTFNEYVYKASGPIDINLFLDVLDANGLDTNLSLYPIDANGYPNTLADTPDMYFQNNGLWYRETGGVNSTMDILTGNNPHAGKYDGGYKYINQFRTLIPNFTPVTITTGTELTTTENIFSNYAQGVITDYTGPTYVDILADDNTKVGDCVVYKAEIVKDPMPEPILTPCGCPYDGEDEMLSVCVEKGKPKQQPCSNLGGSTKYIDENTGFWTVSVNVYKNEEIVDLKNTIFLDKECCKALGGKSAYMDSEYDSGIEGNRDTATSGYVCCTTNKCGCNIACKWALGEYTVNPDGRVYMKPLEPIQIPENSGNYFLQFRMFYGTGGGAVVTPDGSNCISRYTIPVNGIKDPFTGEIGFGCKLTDIGMRDLSYGEDGTLRNAYLQRLSRGAACCEQPTMIKSLYE